MTVDEALAYLALALKRSEEPKVYELIAAVGTEFLDCYRDKEIPNTTISVLGDMPKLYGPYKTKRYGYEGAGSSMFKDKNKAKIVKECLERDKNNGWNVTTEKRTLIERDKKFPRDRSKDIEIIVDVKISKENEKILQGQYIEALQDIFTRNKDKVGIKKFCDGLKEARFAMLKAEPKEAADPKEERKVKDEASKIVATASAGAAPITLAFKALSIEPLVAKSTPKPEGQDSAKQTL